MTSVEKDRRRQRVALVLFLLIGVALIALMGWSAFGRGSSEASSGGTPAPATTTPSPAQVVLMPINTPGDEFTPPTGTDVDVTAIAADSPTGLTEVSGDEVGLYGGTMKLSSCDREQLASFLADHPAKADAWAGVQAVDPAQIGDYLVRLTPLVLRTDTLVTNHGYADGAATTFASVLQAGTAVLVDDYGVPVVRCYCGNPLNPAPDLGPGTTYTGDRWKDWKPERTVRIRPANAVIENFTVLGTDGDSLFTRPAGSTGEQDAPSAEPVPAGVAGVVVDPGPLSPVVGASAAPAATAPAATALAGTPPAGERPPGEPITVFEVTSIAGVSSGPPKPTVLTLDAPTYLTSIGTYHYLNNGTGPGTIGLEGDDGTMYGPWPATGSEGQGGVANAYWTVTPNVTVPAGTYTVVDSDPGTWSWAHDTQQRGITIVQGIPVTAG